jgi:hypothetical protein
MRMTDMRTRYLLIIAVVWNCSIPACLAAGTVAEKPRTSTVCTPPSTATQPSNWTVDQVGSTDYSGIIAGVTTMKLNLHSNPNSPNNNEWQITFGTPTSSKSQKPPAVDTLHFVEVPRTDKQHSLHLSGQSYLTMAYNVMNGSQSYMAATGYVDDNNHSDSTLAILWLTKPDMSTNCRSFTLILVKLTQVGSKYHALQGGVIHGGED